MKIFAKILIIALLQAACARSAASLDVQDTLSYFNSFYCSYLDLRRVDSSNREILDLLHQISNRKISALQKELEGAKTRDEIKLTGSLIEEEYKDFVENLNFETEYVPNCPLKRKDVKKFKKAHKKFMRALLINCKG